MKRIIALFSILILFTFCGYSSQNEAVRNVKVKKVNSDIYSEQDINEAIVAVKKYFLKNFSGCRLERIAYAGDKTTKRVSQDLSNVTNEEVIVLVSDFYVKPNGGDGSLITDYTYTGWGWILLKNSDGKWEHLDHGDV
ncbi:hypothetical protein [uncultured Ruminococcus sp.]|uniref:hypothetical protein n=1 Tax=uncultured Ruminococcus sp. TaxID=165186 RepID=UPI0026304E06|nr:hypothetical protein [uncultured Ruminococcus sp.]